MAVNKRDKDAHTDTLVKIREKDYNLDSSLWRLVEVDGYPIAALYFNGREFSLGVDAMEELTYIIKSYIETDHRARKKTDPQRSGHDHA